MRRNPEAVTAILIIAVMFLIAACCPDLRASALRMPLTAYTQTSTNERTTTQLLREACWICSGSQSEDIKYTISIVLANPHKMPTWLYVAAQNRWADWRNFEVMAEQHWCEPAAGKWDAYIPQRQAAQIRDELDLLIQAGPWVRTQIGGTP
jgi:hypothetical protein